ncbi:hypothetical protein BV25DRAFT_1916328 [Artomyces pyxidatus]|uniref:Uncharacterized protein n=1 Tax=Artomyces pyxidatus TaxID=48021 RepID=A0ACB8T0Q2_9AGAM|nr:hypothetical protein BV25DRAFT_1916328 [Artomyces pyxidatus]
MSFNFDSLYQWVPQLPEGTPKDIVQWLRGLRIPVIKSTSDAWVAGKPDLLLHRYLSNISSFDNTEEIFDVNTNTFLVNTTASGKMALLLDGLKDRWGFYLTEKRDADDPGSKDLVSLLEASDDTPTMPSNEQHRRLRMTVSMILRKESVTLVLSGSPS